MKTLVVISTAASEKEGRKIAQKLVESKLAACVNVIPRVNSYFYWEGKLSREKEVILIMKTTKKEFKGLVNEINKIHSYEIPEIISLRVDGGEERYFKWVNEVLGGGKKKSGIKS